MKLQFIELDKLYVDKANMRFAKRPPDVSDILPSVRKRGILQTLIVRPGEEDRFGILAGSRRFRAGQLIAEERAGNGEAQAEPFQFPCAILEAGDDAAAVEASLIENMARLDPDEVTRWETFVRLVREGQSPEEIADTFALPVLAVRRTLALGNLLPRIRDLYRHEKIDAATVRHLTLASKARQRDWLALWDDPQAHCPTGWQLRGWLLGGQALCARYALFDVEASGVALVTDLFNEERYVADADAFWTAQHAAIEARRAAYLEAGWTGVEVSPATEHFQHWEYEKAPKRKGGRVYIDVRASGEVVFHEGYVSRKEAKRLARGEAVESVQPRAVRPEITGPMQTYIDLHRHAAVRAALLSRPKLALRLMVAHAIAGSHLWRVDAEPQEARSDAIRESVETCRGETVFDAKRRAVLGTLGFDPETPTVRGGRVEGADGDRLTAIFFRLLDLSDAKVMDVIAVLIGETLAAGSPTVEAVGLELGLDMARWWQADAALFDLVRDKEVLQLIVAEVAGNTVANANAGEKGATLKKIVTDHLAGAGGRTRVDNWVPRWMAFPPAAYTARGGVGTVSAHAKAEAARPVPEPDPAPEITPEPQALAA
ncbi:ParB N-terminal domain-containing protein [Sphingomonas psychrotolerans]|uniref:ParB N-terminal domain-containing protein n=1 Tax=Sphingomonas psychrotolerans TaxID=1327635 RepID=A0ABU3N7S0_9SPHN|nr:ParB N-terminal domain-containing protein [Sphingomonas psychrotolerans]MDT8760558.1 ParB N-terminal domain-containing protein [Sphingomonas psychrotolerans]